MQMQGTLRRGQEWPGNPRGTVENSRQQVCREKQLALPLPLTQRRALRPSPSQFPPGYSRLLLRACRGMSQAAPGLCTLTTLSCSEKAVPCLYPILFPSCLRNPWTSLSLPMSVNEGRSSFEMSWVSPSWVGWRARGDSGWKASSMQ